MELDSTSLPAIFGIGGVLFALGTLCTVGVVFGGVGFLIYRTFARSRALGVAAKTWPSTTGKVSKGFVEVSTSDTSTSYTPKVIYEFTVDSQLYCGDTVRTGIVVMRGGYLGAQQIVDRYPEGSTVTVYYNPANPSQCVLER